MYWRVRNYVNVVMVRETSSCIGIVDVPLVTVQESCGVLGGVTMEDEYCVEYPFDAGYSSMGTILWRGFVGAGRVVSVSEPGVVVMKNGILQEIPFEFQERDVLIIWGDEALKERLNIKTTREVKEEWEISFGGER